MRNLRHELYMWVIGDRLQATQAVSHRIEHEPESTDLYLTWRERLWRWRAFRRETCRKAPDG